MAPALMAGEHSQSPQGCTAAKALPWHPTPGRWWEGAEDTPFLGCSGCLFTGAGDFVESQAGAGKHPELHHQLDGGLGLCHLQRNSGDKNCNPWQ